MVKRTRGLFLVLALTALAAAPSPAWGQPRPVESVSVRADLAVDDVVRRIERDGWTVRHNGPWLLANDQWTNPAGVTFFPANTEYFVVALLDDCAACDFELRFFDEDAGGYFSMSPIMSQESDGSLISASGRFEVDRDMRGELYLQMLDGADLYPTYLILAQIR